MDTENSEQPHKHNRQTWKQRTKLEKTLILCLVGTTILLVGILLFIIIKHAIRPKVCRTPSCLQAASQIASHIDPSINPCDDFFKFACGKYIEHSHGDLDAASVKKIIKQVDRRLAEIIKEPIKDDDNYWIKNQKRLLKACMNESVVGNDTMKEFKEMLVELNGWPVLTGYKWNEGVFDWKEMIYKLNRKGYVNSILLDVNVAEDNANNSNRHIPIILIPYPDKISNENKPLYKNYMTGMAAKFGVDRNKAAIEMEKVIDFMESLRKIADEKSTRFQDHKDYNATETRFTVGEYQELNGDIDWLDFINRIIQPVGRVTDDDYVVFPNVEYAEAFFKLIQNTSKRTIANYIIWRLLEGVLPYMPKDLREVRHEFSCLIKGAEIEKDRFKFCQEEIKRSYYYHTPPSHIIYARKYLTKDQQQKIKEMVDNIKTEFLELLRKNSWMDLETKKAVLEKMENLREVIGAPGNYFDDVTFRQLLGDGHNESAKNDSFINMLLNQYKIKQELTFLRLHLNVDDVTLESFYSFITTVNAMYSFFDNTIIIPVGILEDVFYGANRPMYLNYGAIGSIVGHEITHGFGGFGSAYDKNGRKNTIWTNATLKAYKRKTKCVVEEAENFALENQVLKINGTLTLEENVADYTGIKISYGAYKKWINQYGSEPALPEINYTPQQLFWISAVLYECFEFNKDSELGEDLHHAHNSFRVVAPLRNNPDFVKDFDCPLGSRMNPEKKCQVF